MLAKIKYTAKLLFLCAFTIMSCKSSKEFTGFGYDPPNVTNTIDKQIDFQPKRIIGAGTPKVWVSNEFSGARFNDFIQVDSNLFQVNISPELSPINNSPWYAFKIWSDVPTDINLVLNYDDARHRYHPKISKDGAFWESISEEAFEIDSTLGQANLSLSLSSDTTWVSAQEIRDLEDYESWLRKLSAKSFVGISEIGYSHRGRPVKEVRFDHIPPGTPKNVLLVLGRQHPPEIPGYDTGIYFLDELAGDSELAKQFRSQFVVLAYPLMNPDGVEQGHWRYNSGGVDLNRDWVNFNQPETRAVRDAVLSFMEDSTANLVYGVDFHSTDENIFYPILPELPRDKGDITYPWILDIKEAFPNTLMVIEAFDTSSPISKNWIYRTFGADALTYEVSDTMSRSDLKDIAQYAARSLMQKLLENAQKKSKP